MSSVLSDTEIQKALQNVPGWEHHGAAIERSYQFGNFVEAMSFVNQVAAVAESVNHHPDIEINYNRVKLSLTSHDSGGVTQRDLRMAERLNGVTS